MAIFGSADLSDLDDLDRVVVTCHDPVLIDFTSATDSGELDFVIMTFPKPYCQSISPIPGELGFGQSDDLIDSVDYADFNNLGAIDFEVICDGNKVEIIEDFDWDEFVTNETMPKKMKIVCGSFYIPKKDRGDDAHFVCEAQQTIGVADGVGGWADKGIDAGEYARALMNNASLSVRNNKSYNGQKIKAVDFETGSIGPVDPVKVLNDAFLKNKELELQGSSTACILSFSTDYDGGVLSVANVGDSGFMLFRDNKVVRTSRIMQHYFNCPYQLGNSRGCDGPDSADVFRVKGVMLGDVIVLGTDGLLDNMYPSEVEKVLALITRYGAIDSDDHRFCELAADMIADLALKNSRNPKCDSPFSREAAKAGGSHAGGKIDDITVVVARVLAD